MPDLPQAAAIVVPVPYGHHLRPLRLTDEAHYRTAVEGSHGPLRDRHAADHGWPPPVWGNAQARQEVRRQLAEMELGTAWTYALLDVDETALLGCVRVEVCPDGSATAWWWIVAECLGTDLAAAVDRLLPTWSREDWWPMPRS